MLKRSEVKDGLTSNMKRTKPLLSSGDRETEIERYIERDREKDKYMKKIQDRCLTSATAHMPVCD